MIIVDFLFLGLLLIAAITDYKKLVIPDSISLMVCVAALTKAVLLNTLPISILLGVCSFLLFLALSLFGADFGGGDVKLLAPVVAYLGISSIFALLISAVTALIYLKTKKIKSTFFAPFIFIGCLTMCFFNYL